MSAPATLTSRRPPDRTAITRSLPARLQGRAPSISAPISSRWAATTPARRVSGSIQDGGLGGGSGGSLVKTGTGTLTLTGSNTYTGGATILDGTLELVSGSDVVGSISFAGSAAILEVDGSRALAPSAALEIGLILTTFPSTATPVTRIHPLVREAL